MNAAVLNADVIPTARLLGAYWSEVRCDFMRNLRNPGIALPVLLMPVGLYLLIAAVVAGEAVTKDPNVGTFLFGAFGVMAVTMPALFSVGTSFALERDSGLLRLKRAQPAPFAGWLIAKIVTGIALGVLAYVPVLIAAFASAKLPLDVGPAIAMSFALLVGAIPFCALALMIGTFVSGSAAPAWSNLIYLPGCYLSGMFFPLPQTMHWQVPIWPQFHVEQLAMHAAGVAKFQFEPVMVAAGALVGYTVLFSAIAAWRFARKG
jgi:ABC-2 type transport system permease protein